MTDTVLRFENLLYVRQDAATQQPVFSLQSDGLHMRAGDAYGLVGPSGCGKSTLLDILALLRRPSHCAVFQVLGHDVAAWWRRNDVDACLRLRGMHLGVVLQTGGLLPSLGARENVLLSQRLLGKLDLDWVRHLFSVLDLVGLEARLPSQLSIGQRQRVAIARALAHRPALLLADEPTAALGGDHAGVALDLLLGLARDCAAALVVASHDVALLQSRGMALLHCRQHGDVVRVGAA